jgi:23S rRNA-/tRNA-specific pseudouridylate synthase
MAIVNKPEGVVVFGHKNGGYGRHTVKSTLPYVLDPPSAGTLSVLWNPMPVHRIDKATSGLLVVAKTRAAMVYLTGQFKERKIKKTCE